MEDMIAIELAVIIVAMFAIAVGFDCIKDGMCDIGAVIHDIITAPVRHYRQKKLMEQMEREWENLKRLEEFHQVSKKNRYRKCLVTCSEKNPKGRTRKVQRKALFHKWDEIKQVIDASPMIGGHPGGQIAYTLGIVEFMDGTVGQVHPGYIKFLDTEDFAGDCNE